MDPVTAAVAIATASASEEWEDVAHRVAAAGLGLLGRRDVHDGGLHLRNERGNVRRAGEGRRGSERGGSGSGRGVEALGGLGDGPAVGPRNDDERGGERRGESVGTVLHVHANTLGRAAFPGNFRG